MFTADVFSDVANGVNLVLGPATSSGADFSFTDMTLVADTNLVAHDSTSNMTGASMQGRIKKAHPIWGTMIITITCIPMLWVGISMVFMSANPWSSIHEMYCHQKGQNPYQNEVTNIGRLGHSLLLIPFTIVATPWYICYVICTGIREVIWPNYDDSALRTDKAAKYRSNEVLLESSLQICLGMYKSEEEEKLI